MKKIKDNKDELCGVFVVFTGDGSKESISQQPKYTGPKWKCKKWIESAPSLGMWNSYKIIPL